MEHDNQANVERLKDEVIQEYGVNPQRDDLPHDVSRWVELIHENLTSESLTVNWLIEQHPELSKKTSERFCVVKGVSTKTYIIQLRMFLASRLIEEGESHIMAVAMNVGYDDNSSFTKSFAKFVGCLPSLYKKVRGGNSSDFTSKNSSL